MSPKDSLPTAKTTLWLLLIALWTEAGLSDEAARPIPVPTPAQYRWHEQERIRFVHLSPATWQGVEHDNLYVAASLLLLLFLQPAAGADATGAKPKAGTAEKPYEIAWGPFLQNLTPTSVTVLWAGGGAGEELVEYGETKEQLSQSVRSAEARGTITGLKPGKRYFYRVTSKAQGGGPAARSAIASFTTPVEDVQAFSFVILADTHQSKCAPDLAKRILAEKPDFVLHLGDRNPSIVGGLLKPYKEVMQQIPTYMARGNHDTADKQRQFSAMPGPGDQQYYSYRWGTARFILVYRQDVARRAVHRLVRGQRRQGED